MDIAEIKGVHLQERRRVVRCAVHTPAYASMNGSSRGHARELCEIVNISESGACIQAPSPLKVNCLLPLVLDLSETGARIHTTAHVVWAESSGRTGIRFPELPEVSLKQLQEWMALNELAKSPRNGDGAGETAADPGPPVPRSVAPHPLPSSAASYTSLMAEWTEIRREVELFGPNLEGALERIADRAVRLTSSGGAAIALKDEANSADLICVARAGRDSPEVGVRRDAQSGFLGECIRSGITFLCDDSETDPREGVKGFRRVGIRSLITCPIRALKGEVIGVLEVFSRQPAAFEDNDVPALEGLARITAKAIDEAYSTAKPRPLAPVEELPPAAPQPVKMVSPTAGIEAPAAALSAKTRSAAGIEESMAALSAKTRSAAGIEESMAALSAKTRSAAGIEESMAALSAKTRSIARFDDSTVILPPRTRNTVFLVAGVCAIVLAFWLAPPWISEARNSRAPRPPAPEPVTRAADFAGMDTSELTKAALAGNGEAQYTLGIRYASGNGVPADNHQALGWFLKAADSGELRAAAKIASCFWAGKGTEQDYSKAYFWGLLAQAADDETGRVIVINSAPHLRDRQRLAEQQEADNWLRAHRSLGSRASP